jgi:signal transduction histidine kinase
MESIPVRPVVDEVCRQARQLDRNRKIVEEVQDVIAKGDRESLKQVLLITLDNAVKYSQGTITVSSEAVDDWVMISVRDEGPGIDQEALRHVFDRFYRGEADPNIPGFGLGLPIAKSLIEGQGGMISIESQVGDGTIVKLHLSRA